MLEATGSYLGSQAFSHVTGGSEAINRNTGSLEFSQVLVDLRGILGTSDLGISLTYSYGVSGQFGLPDNWTFSIPNVVGGRSFTSQGKTFMIDNDWSDINGHKSGLRYVNNHGMRFQAQIPPEKLPSGKDGEYDWWFMQTDGSKQYFDSAGNLLEQDDVFGNYIYYSYINNTSYLDFIQDSLGQKLTFEYQAGESITITAPDLGQTIIAIGNNNVASITDPVGLITSFEYTNTPDRGLISTISHPSSMISQFQYGKILYYAADGSTGFVPAVTNHYHLDSSGAELSQTTYQFGSGTNGNTFTGFNVGVKFGDLGDALIESIYYQYQYDTLIQNVDSSGRILSASRVFFNQLHLPIEEYHYLVPDGATLVDAYKSTFQYKIDPDAHARNTNYTSPVEIKQFHFDGDDYFLLKSQTYTYDDFGCTLTQSESAWDIKSGKFVPQKTLQKTYTLASWGGQMMESELLKDERTSFQQRLKYILTSDQKQVQTTITEYQAQGDSTFQPWKTKNQTFDSSGRGTSEEIRWSSGANPPSNTIDSYTVAMAYSFETDTSLYSVKITDPQGNSTAQTYDMRVRFGPLVRKTMPLGQTEQFSYDLIGRAVQYSDPFNNTTNMSYKVGADGNTAVTKAQSGYITMQTFDVLGRQIKLSDNGDPTQPISPSINRVLSTTTYDSVSRKISETDILGSITTFDSYDGFNRLLSSTDTAGNVTTHTYNDHDLTSQSAMNGIVRGFTQSDAYGRSLRITQIPDPGDTTTTYSLMTEHTYDGLGNIMESTLTQQTKPGDSSPITLERTEMEFNVENAISQKQVTTKSDLGNDQYDSVTRNLQYDIFGQVYCQSKRVNYSDGRSFSHTGSLNCYDSCNQLITRTNQQGQVESYSYDANGNMVTLARYDGTVVTYRHDAIGRLVAVDYGPDSNAVTQTYLSNGRLSEIGTIDGIVTNSYNLDGSATSVKYTDGKSQVYNLDKAGQVLGSTDAVEVPRNITYNDRGHVLTRTLGADTTAYVYGPANNTQGQLVGVKISGGQQNLSRVLSYDGFGRVNRVTVTSDSSGQVMLDSIYVYNPRGQLFKVEQSSETLQNSPELNYQRTFLYDGLGQLRQDSVDYTNKNVQVVTKYTYDGNTNLIIVDIDGVVQNMTYNSIDQRADPGFVYDTNGRLIADDKGRKYTYASNDQLLSVTVGGSDTSFKYHPNGSLGTYNAGSSSTRLWYDTGAVNATQSTEGEAIKSYLLDPGHILLSNNNTSKDTAYFVDSQGSVAIETGKAGSRSTMFNVFGQGKSSSTTGTHSFGYRQEFTDNVSNLIYLRSRYYQPDYAAFITLDSVDRENRYAFCVGDPINLYDGTGHIEWIPLIVDIAVTVVVATACAPAAGAIGAALFEAGSLGASVTSAVLSKATGYVVGGYVGRKMQHEHYDAEKFAIDAFSGALAGVVTASSAARLFGRAERIALEAGRNAEAAAEFANTYSSWAGKALGVTAGMASLAVLNHATSSTNALESVVGSRPGAPSGLQYDGAYRGIFASSTPGISLQPLDPGDAVHGDMVHGIDLDLDWKFINLAGSQDESSRHASTEYKDQRRTGQLHVKRNSPSNADTSSSSSVGNSLHISTRYRQNGEVVTSLRPVKARLFAQQQYLENIGHGRSDAKVNACFGGLLNGQDVSNAIGKRVFATYATR